MIGEKELIEGSAETEADVMLQKLLHLKTYERPETARMTRNRQNIMRKVREAEANRKKSIFERLELSIPWFFAEPKYGIALLFVAFAALQYANISSRNASRNQSTGIYTTSQLADTYQQPAMLAATNNIVYPELPAGIRYFPEQHQSSDIMFVNRIEPQR